MFQTILMDLSGKELPDIPKLPREKRSYEIEMTPVSKGVRLYADLGINFHNFFVFWIWMMQFGTERANGCF